MEKLNLRHTEIIEILEENEFISVKELADKLDVSLVTVRKDLTLLEKKGYVFRTHGGVSKRNLYAYEKPILEKQTLQVDEKIKIAKKATSLISENDFLVLASGTTVYYLAQELLSFNQLTVCTPSLSVSILLGENPLMNIIQIGGELRKSSRSVIGSIAENAIKQYSAHLLFLGVDGIDLNFGISTSNAAEAQLNKTMLSQADKVVVLADATKINKKGFGKIADIEEIDILITNKPIDHAFLHAIQERGVEVLLV
ncbi:MAG: DeoR/GlpR family DNA-binding transcription regulator [Weeksellaceae bacterium]